MTVIDPITLAEAEAQLADAKVQLDAEAERSFDGTEPAYVKAETEWMAACLRVQAIASQEPTRGRAFSEDFAL